MARKLASKPLRRSTEGFPLGRRYLPARVPEAAEPPGALGQLVLTGLAERDFLDGLDDELGDAVSSFDLVVDRGVGVDEQDAQFVAVSGVDEAGGVETSHPVAQGQAATGKDEAGIPRRKSHGDAGGHEGPASAGGDDDVLTRMEVRPGVTLMCVGRDGQVGIEPDERHFEHGRDHNRDPIPRSTLPARGRAPVSIALVLVWMDLEMTGLDPARHTIVEIATLITDDNLAVVAEGPDLVVHADAAELAAMDDFVRDMHTRSGLLEAITASTLTLDDAGRQTLEFIKAHVPEKRTVPLCGNSIGTDRRFLAAQLPDIENWLHYRSVDVSTVKELCRRWYPGALAKAPEKGTTHRALEDIRESLAELSYYRSAIFAPGDDSSVEPDPDHGKK
jgi:oligoribonuclease